MSRCLFIALIYVTGVFCFASLATAQQPGVDMSSGPRIALVIGNANYPDAAAPLIQPIRSERLLADELRRNGFVVDAEENLGKDELSRAFDAFEAKIKPDSTALLFFSGFALQSDRQTFLIPVNAQIWTESDIRRDGIDIETILSDIERKGARVKLLILDASRPNPYERRFRRVPIGLSTIAAPVGTLIISAGSPGKVIDDDRPDSIFISELIKEMRGPGVSADKIFNETRIGVARATKGEQVLWVASTLGEDFYFTKPAPSPAETSSVADSRSAQRPVREEPAVAARRDPAEHAAAPRRTEAAATPDGDPGRSGSKPGDIFRDCSQCPELVLVPAGFFEMGSNDSPFEKPVHRVHIARAFAVGRREITTAEWDQCVAAGSCARGQHAQEGGDRPMTDISWSDAKAYAAWLSRETGQKYRLPTEAEWEYVARGGTRTAYWWGRDVRQKFANCRDCGNGSSGEIMATGSFFANPFGVFDTAGNAAEWVEDCWNDSYRNAPTDGSAWTKGECRQRVLRGGSFDSDARYLRSASRFRYDADVRYYANGFRIVRELP